MLLARPRLTLGVLAVLTIAVAYLGLRHASFDTAPDTIVDPGSISFRHEIEFENTFGADPIVLLIATDVKSMFSGNGLQQEIATEANLATSDNQKFGVQSVYGPSSFATVTGYAALSVELAQLQTAQQAASQKATADAKAAGKSDADAQAAGQAAATAAGNAFLTDQAKAHPELAQIGIPSATNPSWMTALFINSDTGQPKPKFVSFVPDSQHLLVTARLNPNTGEPQVNGIVASINKTLHDNPIPAARVTVSGVPVLENAIIRALRLALLVGMLAGAISMMVLLAVALRRRTGFLARLLPIAAGLLTVAALVGVVGGLGYLSVYMRGLGFFGTPVWQSILATFSLALNPATLAAFPIALGLAVDYSVQFLYRYTQVEGEPSDALGASRRGAGRATRRAAICTVAGLLALMLSGIPMVRQFGVTMIIGTAVAWGIARVLTLTALQAWPRLGRAPMPKKDEEAEVVASGAVTAAGQASAAAFAAASVSRTRPPEAAPAPAASPPALAQDPADDDVALFGLGGAAAHVPDLAVGAAAGGPPAATPRREWIPATWSGATTEVLAAQRPATVAPVVAASVEAERATAQWRPSPWGSSDSTESAMPAPAAPETPVEPVAQSAEPTGGPSDWQARWNATDAPEAVIADDDDADEDRPRPGAIPVALLRFARRRTAWVLAPALVMAVAGWIAFPFSTYQTDPEKLVSPNLPAFRDLNAVRQATGTAGELDFILSGADVTTPEALKWVNDFQTTVERDSAGKIRPVTSLAKLFNDINGGQTVTADQATGFLGLLPTYVTNALVDPGHHLARIAFGLSPGPIEDQKKVIDQVLREVQAPSGYTYYAAGFTYLGISGLDALKGGQIVLNLVGAALVLGALFAIYRRPRMALMAWAPTLLVAGWSTAVLFVLRQPLTPMTAVLGALVVAFGTEFAILWLERYRDALADGIPAGAEAAEVASRAAGPGIILSGAALTLGFLALTVGALPGLSRLGFDLPMVRDFGLVAAMDMILAVVASLLVLPAIVVRLGLSEEAAKDPAPRLRGARRGARRPGAKQEEKNRARAPEPDVSA